MLPLSCRHTLDSAGLDLQTRREDPIHRVLKEEAEVGLLRDADSGFRLTYITYITALQLVCLGICNGNFVEKRPISAVLPGVPNTCDNI